MRGTFVGLFVGALLALSVGLFATAVGLDGDRAFYPVVTVVIATYYALFAVMGASTQALVLECLAKDKASRPRSADIVAQRLAELSGTWTPASARTWWQTHQPGVALPCCDEAHGSKRCWPRLDRETLTVF